LSDDIPLIISSDNKYYHPDFHCHSNRVSDSVLHKLWGGDRIVKFIIPKWTMIIKGIQLLKNGSDIVDYTIYVTPVLIYNPDNH